MPSADTANVAAVSRPNSFFMLVLPVVLSWRSGESVDRSTCHGTP
jgi:hypothetical protein